MFSCDANDVVEFGQREIRSNLEKYRRRACTRPHPFPRIDHAGQQIIQRLRLLQITQTWRVRRGHVDRKITGDGGERLDQSSIILGSIFRVAIGADIDANDPARTATGGKPHMHRSRTAIIEAQPIDDRLVGLEAKQARSRVAGLGLRRDRSDLYETEAEPKQRVRNFRILVKTGRKADGIRKLESERTDGELVAVGRRPGEGHKPQRLNGKPVRVLRIERTQERSPQAVEKTDQQAGLHGIAVDPIGGPRVYSRLPPKEMVATGGQLKVIIPIYRPQLQPVQAPMPMLSHNQIWTAIDRLAARAKLTPSGLAKKAGLDPTTFNKSKRVTPEGRPRWPSTESVAKALQATSTKFDTFVTLISDGGKATMHSVPVIGFAQAGTGGFFDDGGFPVGKGWEEIAFPSVNDEHAYALEISGDSMKPAYRNGDVIIVSPGATVRKGDRVVLKTKDGEVMVKELKRKTAKSVELKSLNSEHRDRTLPAADVVWLARIVWASQ